MSEGPFSQVGRAEKKRGGEEKGRSRRPPHFRHRGEREDRLPLRETQHDHGGELTHRPQIKQLPACSGSQPDPQLGVCALVNEVGRRRRRPAVTQSTPAPGGGHLCCRYTASLRDNWPQRLMRRSVTAETRRRSGLIGPASPANGGDPSPCQPAVARSLLLPVCRFATVNNSNERRRIAAFKERRWNVLKGGVFFLSCEIKALRRGGDILG